MPSGHKAAGPASACSDFPGSGVDPLVSGGAGSLGSVWEPDHSPRLRGQGMGTELHASSHRGLDSVDATHTSEFGPFTSIRLGECCHPD